MAAAVEEAVFNALRGHHNEKTKLPTPRIIKIYVASLKEGKWLLTHRNLTESRREGGLGEWVCTSHGCSELFSSKRLPSGAEMRFPLWVSSSCRYKYDMVWPNNVWNNEFNVCMLKYCRMYLIFCLEVCLRFFLTKKKLVCFISLKSKNFW